MDTSNTFEFSSKCKVPSQYLNEYLKVKDQLINYSGLSNDWKLYLEKDGITGHTRFFQDFKVEAIRIEGIFNASVEETAQLLFEDSQELVNSKPAIKSAEIVEDLGEEGKIVIVTTKSLFLISARDILVYANSEKYGDGIIQVQVGLSSHPKAPLKQGIVRSTTVFGGNILIPTQDGKTKVVYLILNLLNGNIPASMNNIVKFQHHSSYIYFKNLLEKRRKQEKEEKNQIQQYAM